jgi:L-ascorbate 6-phosphate lactonase
MSAQGAVEVTWLGQSGYALRSPGGQLLLLDPYLSDFVEHELGQKRIVPAPEGLLDEDVSAVLITHWHPDHYDPPTIRALVPREEVVFAGPPSVTGRIAGLGVAPERLVTLHRDDTATVGDFTVTAGFARHEVPGWLAEDALSLVVEVAGRRIFHSGDTEYDSRLLPMREHGPFDLGIFVSNGSGGNMNALEASLMAHQLAPAIATPAHYGMWADEIYGPGATLDPQLFVDTCARLGGPECFVFEHLGTLRLPVAAPVEA